MIVLASGSPRRKMLLESIGLEFTVYRPDIDESILDGEDPVSFCVRLSGQKALAGAKVYPEDVVIAADTIVVIGGEILGKPVDREDAVRMLKLLSGREHEVITGLSLWHDGVLKSKDVHTKVKFREMTADEISAYTSTGECDDKAGAYAVQGRGSIFIESINGDFYNVVGLPLCTLWGMLSGISLL